MTDSISLRSKVNRSNYRSGLCRLPYHMHRAVRRWIDSGVLPEGFLSALLENDLMQAVGMADDVNLAAIQDWCLFLFHDAPSGCYGSARKVAAWKKHNGLKGQPWPTPLVVKHGFDRWSFRK